MRRKVGLLAGLVGLVLLGALLVLGWALARRPSIPYLPEDGPARWIVYPSAADAGVHPRGEQRTLFSRAFDLARPPAHAPLRVRAYGGFTARVNDQTLLTSEPGLARDWKREAEGDAAPALVAGANHLTIIVSNDQGPPALWITLSAGDRRIVSDGEWECSQLGAVMRPARLASAAPELGEGNPAAEGESVSDAFVRGWPPLVLLLVLATAGVVGLDLGMRRGYFTPIRRLPWSAVVLAAAAVPWLVLLVNNGRSLHFSLGYDFLQHAEYIQYVQRNAALPLADRGWEMHQPPLYYVVSASALTVCGLNAEQAAGALVLRGLALLAGLALGLLLAGCLRRLMPQAPAPQAVGLLVAVCLPVHLYLMHYLSNDLLAGTLATAAVYVGLTVLQTERPSNRRLAVLGLCLGAALLTKLTTAAVVLLVAAVLAGRLAARRSPPKDWLRVLGVPFLVCSAVSGWFFVRNVSHFGTPFIGSYDPRSGLRWWQDPGYGTAAQGLRFGRSLTHPYYSVFAGIPDGLYSTLWGDGTWAGAMNRDDRPPWDYDRMAAGYVLALVPSILVLVGAAAAVVELVRRPRAEWFLVMGLPVSVGLAMLYHYVCYPYHCHVKAFYALPAVLSLCAFAGRGFAVLAGGSRWRRLALGAALATWALVAYTSFWVDAGAADTRLWVAGQYRYRGELDQAFASLNRVLKEDPDHPRARRFLGELLMTRHPDRAAAELRRALRAAPEDAKAHALLGSALMRMGQTGPAGEHLERAVALGPDSAPAHELLTRLRWQRADVPGTREAAEEGLRVRPTSSDLHEMLAAALAAGGGTEDAARHYQIALRWQPDAVAALKGLARLRATCEDDRYRDGRQAVRLARRACELTDGRDLEAVELLAAAYAESGRFHDAELLLEQVAAAAPPSEKESLRRQLRLYQSERPLRQKPTFGPPLPKRREAAPDNGKPRDTAPIRRGESEPRMRLTPRRRAARSACAAGSRRSTSGRARPPPA